MIKSDPAVAKPKLLTLKSGNWYGYEMLPGYTAEPYCSPILVDQVVPQKSGRAILHLRFFNACYAKGVQDFQLDMHVLWRSPEYLIAELLSDANPPTRRSVIVCDISFAWLKRKLSWLIEANPPSTDKPDTLSVSEYLNGLNF